MPKRCACALKGKKVLASNIANADTPNYKARDFDFASALAQATGQSAPGSNTGLAAVLPNQTQAGHLGTQTANAVATSLKYRTVDQPSLDGNTVDMDIEQARFGDNALRYEASLRFLNLQIKTMTSAVTGQS